MIDVTTLIEAILGFSAFNLIMGYILGHYGLQTVKTDLQHDLTLIKGLIHGQTVTVVPISSGTSGIAPATPVVIAADRTTP